MGQQMCTSRDDHRNGRSFPVYYIKVEVICRQVIAIVLWTPDIGPGGASNLGS